MSDRKEIVKIQPIHELILDPIKPNLVDAVLCYMHELGCSVEEAPGKRWNIKFPPGTIEETYAGQSTQFTHKTLLRFPTGEEIDKYIEHNIKDLSQSTINLGLPSEVLYPPEK